MGSDLKRENQSYKHALKQKRHPFNRHTEHTRNCKAALAKAQISHCTVLHGQACLIGVPLPVFISNLTSN